MVMNITTIISHTPAQLAMMCDVETLHGYIGYYTGLDIDSLANMIGRNTISDVRGAELVDNLEAAWGELFCDCDPEYPDYNPTELAADMVLYTAWQLARLA